MTVKMRLIYPSGYDVGYGKPPQNTRFKPGKSGNPKGRPKGRKTVSSIMNGLLSKKVPVRTKDSIVKMPLLEAMLHQQVTRAVQGDQKSVQFVVKYLEENDQFNDDTPVGLPLAVPEVMSAAEFEAAFGGNRRAEMEQSDRQFIEDQLKEFEEKYGTFKRKEAKS